MSSERKRKSWKRIAKHKIFRKRNIISLLSIILTSITGIIMLSTNWIPKNYATNIWITLLALNIIGIISINVHKKAFIKGIGGFLLGGSILLSLIPYSYIITTNQFFQTASKQQASYDKTTYCLIKSIDNPIKEDALTGEVITYKVIFNKSGVMKKLNKKYPLKDKEYPTIENVMEQLKQDKAIALMDYSLYEALIASNEVYHSAEYEILYKFDVYTKKEKENSNNKDKYNIYLETINPAGLIDFNWVISLNHKTKKALITIIPTNLNLPIYEKQSKKDWIGYQKTYGPSIPKKSIEQAFEINLDYTISINTNDLVSYINSYNGIEYCAENEYKTTTPSVLNLYESTTEVLTISASCENYNGLETIAILREQEEDSTIQIIQSILDQIKKTRILSYKENLDRWNQLAEMNLPKSSGEKIIKDIIENTNWEINVQTIEANKTKQKIFQTNIERAGLEIAENKREQIRNEINKVLE